MRLRTLGLIVTLGFGILLAPPAAEAQPPGKVYRIGFLSTVSSSAAVPRVEAFRLGLRELGYVEGQNITIEYRWAEGRDERLPGLAAELVRLKVDVIVTQGTVPTLAARQASTTIPIVIAVAGDPVAMGLVASLARPGGNITGLSQMNPEVSGKRLELLSEIIPGLTRVAVLWNTGNPVSGPVERDGIRDPLVGVAAPIPGRERSPWVRQRLLRDEQRDRGCSHRAVRHHVPWSTKTDFGPRGNQPAAGNRLDQGVCGVGRPHELRAERARDAPARRDLRG